MSWPWVNWNYVLIWCQKLFFFLSLRPGRWAWDEGRKLGCCGLRLSHDSLLLFCSFNQLCLPTYDSYEEMHRMLKLAISEGCEGFGMVWTYTLGLIFWSSGTKKHNFPHGRTECPAWWKPFPVTRQKVLKWPIQILLQITTETSSWDNTLLA